jgi:hypothetical protein
MPRELAVNDRRRAEVAPVRWFVSRGWHGWLLVDAVRPIRDEIERRVRKLLDVGYLAT